MKSTKRETAGGELGVILASDLVLAVNPRVTFRWSSKSADADNRVRNPSGGGDESVGLSTLRTEERTLLALADGRRSIDDLARLAGMPILVAVRVLRSLYDRGILVSADKIGVLDRPVVSGPGVSGPDVSDRPEGGGDRPTEIAGARPSVDALAGSGPVEYDYGSVPEEGAPGAVADATARNDAGSGPSLAPVPSGTVVVDAAEVSSSGARVAGSTGAAEKSAPVGDGQSQPKQSQPKQSQPKQSQPNQSQPNQSQPNQSQPKKTTSGPNVTLFWIPSAPDSATPSPVPSGEPSGEAIAALPSRKNTPDSTVVVRGSTAALGSAPTERAAGGAPPGGSVPVTATSPPSSAIPFRVGAYEVATRIAQGAMGSIYVCRRVGAGGFQRLFTLKVIRQHSNQKEMAIKSFTREARIGALLNHPNVQKLVDVGSYEEQPFLILDYVEGTSLGELMGDDRKPPAPVVISVMLDILRGLQHVHDVADGQGTRLGLVHGDVSPQNVLVGVDGTARLTDFGSARFARDEQAVETDAVAVGKPSYMAPEQLRGDPIDARTDLFSVGIVMWTALTGQKLFSAETYDQTVMRVMRRKVPPPSEFGAPACLDPIILKALSRAPEGRYASAEEMSRDILKAAATENLVASPRDVEQWVRRELGDTLADRRRKIQEMFGGTGRPAEGPAPARAPRPHRMTPKTADGFERLPARTVQIGAAGLGWAASNRPPPRRGNSAPRSQWVLVIGSAVVAACALAVAIAYFVSSVMTPQKRPTKKMAVTTSEVTVVGAAPAPAPPRPEPAAKGPDPRELRSDTPPGQ